MDHRRKGAASGASLASTKEAAETKKKLGLEVGNQFRGFGFKPVEPSEDRIRQKRRKSRQKRNKVAQAPIPGEREADFERVRAILARQFNQRASQLNQSHAKKKRMREKAKKEARAERAEWRGRHETSDRQERQLERLSFQPGIIEAERRALRRFDITGGDAVALGAKSSGWPEYKEVLKAKLVFLKKANIRRANEAASALNRMGFKTGSGQTWTPRLVNIAKKILFEKMD